LINPFKHVIQLGVTSEMPFESAQQIRLTNWIALLPLLAYFFYIGYGVAYQQWFSMFLAGTMIILTVTALWLNAIHHYGWAKALLIGLNTLSITITYHVFNVDYAVMSSYFPLVFCFAYFFDLSKERKPFVLGLIFVAVCIASNFLLPRQYFFAVNLSSDLVESSNLFHILISFAITGLLMRVILKNQITTNRKVVEAKNEAVRYNQLQTDFLANISHEIRTPLNGIVGISELLKTAQSREDFEEYLRTIRASGRLLNSIISDVLDITKLEANQIELESKEFRLRGSIRNSLNITRTEIKDRPVSCSAIVDDEVPLYLNGDRNRLEQILSNLLNNAIKFTKEGGITLRVSVVSKTDQNIELQFVIQDTGPGIPVEKQGFLFDRFYQVNSARNREKNGAGLGLAICKSLVELMGGVIWVESEVGTGSKFYFTARFGLHDPMQSMDKSVSNFVDLTDYATLVVEDNKINQMVIMKMLEQMNASVTLVEDGYAAEKLMISRPFDLVFMDLQMPGQDGLVTTRNVRAAEDVHQPYIIALTASAFQETKDECRAAGMNAYLSKPVLMSDLKEVSENYLRSISQM